MSYINTEDLYMIQTSSGHRDFVAGHNEAVSMALDWRWARVNHGLITVSIRGWVTNTFVSAIAEETISRSTR